MTFSSLYFENLEDGDVLNFKIEASWADTDCIVMSPDLFQIEVEGCEDPQQFSYFHGDVPEEITIGHESESESYLLPNLLSVENYQPPNEDCFDF